jgi:hypothetical protein
VKRGKGGGAMTMNLPGLQASLEAHGKPGQVDQVSVDPKDDTIGYQAGAGGTGFRGTLLASPGAKAGAHSSKATTGLSDHLVGFETSSGKGAGDQVSFGSGRAFAFSHDGAPTSLSLTLSAFDAMGRPVAVRLPAVHVGSGAMVKVTPANWRALVSSRIRISTTAGGRTSTRDVRGRTIGSQFATVRHASIVKLGGGGSGVALKLHLRHPPKRGWIAFAGGLSRGGHSVGRTRPLQLSAQAMRRGKALLQLPKGLKGGHYTLKLRALETTAEPGGIQGSQTVTRSFKLRLGKG